MLKDERLLQDRVKILEKEIQTLTLELQKIQSRIDYLEEVRIELKALKVFLGRLHPDLKNKLPEIVRKIKTNQLSE